MNQIRQIPVAADRDIPPSTIRRGRKPSTQVKEKITVWVTAAEKAEVYNAAEAIGFKSYAALVRAFGNLKGESAKAIADILARASLDLSQVPVVIWKGPGEIVRITRQTTIGQEAAS